MITATQDIDRLRAAATGGDATAQYELAVILLRQHAGGSIPEEARTMLLAAANQGHAAAQTIAGNICLKTSGAGFDPEQAVSWYSKAAAGGDAEGYYRLAELTALGLGTTRDGRQARQLFASAADNGHLQAMCQLAYCLGQGIGGDQDPAGAKCCLQEAARRGSGRAWYELGCRYESGNTLPHHKDKALACYRLAAQGGYPGADSAVSSLSHGPEISRTQSDPTDLMNSALLEVPDAMFSVEVDDAAPRLLSERPRVVLHPSLVSPEECAHLVAVAIRHLRPSAVISHAGKLEKRQDYRSSQEATLSDHMRDVVVANIEQRLADRAGLPVENGEPLMILRYGPDDEYLPHVDYFDPANPANADILRQGGQRVVSMLIYLNEVDQGGATVFPKINLIIPPVPGSVLQFHNVLPDGRVDELSRHAGAPVVAGEKWLATRWIRERDWRRPD